MKSLSTRITALFAATIVCAGQAVATPPGLTFNSATPTQGTTLYVARTATNNPLDPQIVRIRGHYVTSKTVGAT
jgi:hypothetical protein